LNPERSCLEQEHSCLEQEHSCLDLERSPSVPNRSDYKSRLYKLSPPTRIPQHQGFDMMSGQINHNKKLSNPVETLHVTSIQYRQ
jgi:hypothetical protein